MKNKFENPEIPGTSTVEIDAEYLLSVAVDDLLASAKDAGLEIDKSAGNNRQNIESLIKSVDDLRKMMKSNQITAETVNMFFDGYLRTAINNKSTECQEFKLKLTKALLTEIQQRLDIQGKNKPKI